MVILQLIFNEDPKDTCLSTVEVVEPLGGFWAQVQGDIFYFPRFQRCGSLSPLAATIPGVPGLLSHILPFFKAVLKIQLARIKKCSKIGLCILEKLCQLCLPPAGSSLAAAGGEVEANPSWLCQLYKTLNLIFVDQQIFHLMIPEFSKQLRDPLPVQKEMGSTDITPWTVRHQQFPQKGWTWSTLEKERAHLSTLEEK